VLGILLFCAGVVASLAASWLLVSRLERLGERAGFSEAWLGLVAALAADAPEITSAVVALARGQASVGAGVVIGSNVFNLAALLGLAAVVAGWIGFHRRVVVLSGIPAVWVAVVCLLPAQWRTAPACPGGLWQRESVLPGWSTGRLWRLSLIVCGVVAACDAASGPHLILIGLLIAGPCGALLTARWALTAAAGGFAVVLGVVLGVPDQIFATVTQYAFLAAVATVGTTATVGAAVLQRQRP
jgi:hypothetical protein